MTTTLIYEPIASISDDYFFTPKAGSFVSSRGSTDDHGVLQIRRLALNITDGNANQLDRNLPEANNKERDNFALSLSTATWYTFSGDTP
jgi:hypothetical protein